MKSKNNKVYLLILDGYGIGKHDTSNGIHLAKQPFLDDLWKQNNLSELITHGESVGLPSFQMGGSEVGHLTLGSGRVIKHLLTKINDTIDSGEFFENKHLKKLFTKAQQKGRIHFMGMISDGGVHSFLPHLFGLQKTAKDYGIKEIYIHTITDGRDTAPHQTPEFLKQVTNQNIGTIASLSGRFYAMDRDNNWERTEAYFDTLTNPKTEHKAHSALEHLHTFNDKTEDSDYYLEPALFEKEGQIQPDDIVINFNYRSDRMRQISQALCNTQFNHFKRDHHIQTQNYGTFGNYLDGAEIIFHIPKEAVQNTLGEVLEQNNLTQLRVAETEKFNHVTYFFSGERKEPFQNEERILIPSPKVPSYAEKPEMSAIPMTDAVIEKLKEKDFDFVVHNYANPDLVGHSGDIHAVQKAVETVNDCCQRLIPFLLEKNYTIIITADHGNSDEMLMPNGEVSMSHSKNLVPCAIFSKEKSYQIEPDGTLADIAPSACELLGIEKPDDMTGNSLLQ